MFFTSFSSLLLSLSFSLSSPSSDPPAETQAALIQQCLALGLLPSDPGATQGAVVAGKGLAAATRSTMFVCLPLHGGEGEGGSAVAAAPPAAGTKSGKPVVKEVRRSERERERERERVCVCM